MALSNAAKSGVAIFVGAVQFSILLVVSEIIYSTNGTNPSSPAAPYGYSVSANYISDLGATCPATGTCYIPPSAMVFDTSVALLGLMVLAGAYFFHRAFRWMPATALIAMTGVGALGVGLFPETTGVWHVLFSFITFFFAGLSAIVAYRYQKPPMSYFSVVLGVVTLAALFLSAANADLGLGAGGIERMVAYPTMLWAIGFGGHMMAIEDKQPT